MEKQKVSRGVSKAQWLEEALAVLSDHSVGEISVKGLAKRLGIAKSGFYWHFKDRDDLLDELLDYWIHEVTEVISNNPQLHDLAAKQRLLACARMIVDHDLTRFEIGIRQFALTDARAARKVKKANQLRMEFVGGAFEELGFKGAELEMRTRMFVCYHTWETLMFPEVSQKRKKQLLERRIDFLVSA